MHKEKKIFIAMITIALVVFLYSSSKASNQVAQRKEDYSSYLTALKYIQNEENLEEAEKILNNIEKKYIKTAEIMRSKAITYIFLEKYDKAEKSLEEAFNLNKKLQENVDILLVYAELAEKNKHNDKALKAIDKLNTMETSKEQKEKITEIKNKIG